LTCNSNYKIPVDQSNKLAISIHYYSPFKFIYEYYYEPFNSTDDEGITVTYFPNIFWGNYLDYFRLFEDFKLIKSYFVDKGIPVIISEVGVYTEQKKEIESIREYLYMLFSLSSDYDGIMCCLRDTSNKIFGEMNFYDRTNDIWYDEKLKDNFLQISKGKYVKPMNFFININFETNDEIFEYFSLIIYTKNRKVLKILINAKLTGVLFEDFELSIYTNDKNGEEILINYGKDNIKKQYDGTNIITIDVNRIECHDLVKATIEKGMKYITLNNMTLEFEESFQSIDYKSLKNAISSYIY
jgi:hypothetical protein